MFDTDGGTIGDGAEDRNKNGRLDVTETSPNDPSDDRIPGIASTNTAIMSASNGGLLEVFLDFDLKYYGQPYRVIGSSSANSGFTWGGVTVPVDFSPLAARFILQDYYSFMFNCSGLLDINGDAIATMVVPAGAAPSGLTLYWAGIALSPSGLPNTSTNSTQTSFQ